MLHEDVMSVSKALLSSRTLLFRVSMINGYTEKKNVSYFF